MKKELQELYNEIKHGDEEHQKWLYDKMEEFSKKRIFNKKDIAKILLYGIHEHNSAIGLLRSLIHILRRDVGKLNPQEFSERLDTMYDSTIKAIKSMDYIYEQIKKLEGY